MVGSRNSLRPRLAVRLAAAVCLVGVGLAACSSSNSASLGASPAPGSISSASPVASPAPGSTSSAAPVACRTDSSTQAPSTGGGFELVYEITDRSGKPTNPDQAMLDAGVSIFQSRLAALGLTDSQVAASGGSSTSAGSPAEIHVVVHPSSSDLRSEVQSLLGQTGQLSFVSLPSTTYGTFGSPGTKPIPASGDDIDPSLPPQFTGAQLDPNAFAVHANADCTWAVDFAFRSSASAVFETWSRQHVNDYFAIVLDGRVIAAPYVESAFVGGKGDINGRFTPSSATLLAAILRSGALPYAVQEIALQPVP